MKIIKNQNLAKYNSWGVGGKAEYFALPTNQEELLDAIDFAHKEILKITYIGGGSSSLISDQGIDGLVICLKEFKGMTEVENSENGRLEIIANTGVDKKELLSIFLKHSLPPARMLAAQTGDVGTALAENESVSDDIRPNEFFEIVDWVEVLRENKIYHFEKEELIDSFKKSKGWKSGTILRIGMSWPLEEADPVIIEKVRELTQKRKEKDKEDLLKFASVFSNSRKRNAGEIISECGLSGYEIGGAKISERFPNFIINTGSATAKEIKSLIEYVQKKVEEEKHIHLKSKVQFVGDFDY